MFSVTVWFASVCENGAHKHGSQVEVSGRIVWMGPDHLGQHPQPSHAPQGKTSGIRPFQDPSVKVAAAEERVAKFEGPEVDGAGCPPASVGSKEVLECEPFLVRARSQGEVKGRRGRGSKGV